MSPDLRAWRLTRRQVVVGLSRAAVASVGALALFGCQKPAPQAAAPAAGAGPAGGPKRGGTIKLGFELPAPTLDPHQTASQGTHNPLGLAYSRLVRFKTGLSVKKGELVLEPDLAERWEQPDDKTYVFHLRPGVKFHNIAPVNGREVTSEDVKFTFQRLISEPASTQKSLFSQIAQIDTPDKNTVKFTLKEQFAPFINYVAAPYTWIIPRELVENGEIKNKMIGTGPFMVTDYTPNVSIMFKRNPDYFESGKPYLDEIQWLIIPDDTTRLSSFRTKEIDALLTATSRELVESVQKSVPDIQVPEYPATTWRRIYFRTDQPDKPFSKQKVRQAMSLALDRQAMIDVLLKGKGDIEGPMMAQLVDWALPIDQLGAGAKYFKRDLAEAKRLLADAGFANGFKMDLWSTQGLGQFHVSFLEMVKAQLAEVGIDVTLRWQDFNTFVTTTHSGKYEDAGSGGWSPVTDPDDHLSKAFFSKGARNLSHANDPVLDDMILKQVKIADLAERKKAVGEIQRYLAEQHYYITTIAEAKIQPFHAHVKGYWPSILLGLGELRETWLEK